jgi:hypothetical protein
VKQAVLGGSLVTVPFQHRLFQAGAKFDAPP